MCWHWEQLQLSLGVRTWLGGVLGVEMGGPGCTCICDSWAGTEVWEPPSQLRHVDLCTHHLPGEQEKALEKVLEQLGIYRLGICKCLIAVILHHPRKLWRRGQCTHTQPFQVFLFSITKKGRKSVLNPSQLPTQSHISTPAEVDSFYQVVDKRAHLDAAVTQQRCCLQHWKLKFVDVTYRWSKLLSWWHLVILVTLFQFSEPLNVNMVVFYTGKS